MVSKYKRLMTTVPIDDLYTPKHLPKLFPKRGDLCEALSSLGDVQAGITAGHVAARPGTPNASPIRTGKNSIARPRET